ncbi:nuclear transport factor 2 family protein [Actinomyces sp. MRS3W]|uniref:nuclear transport factor 2 family protein n=1 Tax=Actinomyces sp. MRS3W TaxID=2800796 RepID=UPI0028FD72DB|nr:nuclear transport factor 2 family protein [Actinomyces sp. MRS3W]MDU0348030.1 nuclear transport factor 2 family protein [Actinomyces sp. MRS3W]
MAGTTGTQETMDAQARVHEYFRAWTSGNIPGALALMTDDVTVNAPNGEYHGEAGYRDFLEGFLRLLDAVEESTILVDGDTAIIWYRYRTRIPGLAPQLAAERITLRQGRIAIIDYLFDQVPFAQAFGSATGADLHEAVNRGQARG